MVLIYRNFIDMADTILIVDSDEFSITRNECVGAAYKDTTSEGIVDPFSAANAGVAMAKISTRASRIVNNLLFSS